MENLLDGIHLQLTFDGSCTPNPGEGACGSACHLLRKGEDSGGNKREQELFADSRKLGLVTSNIAEYMGLIMGLRRLARELPSIDIGKYVHVHVVGDSELVINQLKGRYQVTDPILRVLHKVVLGLLSRFAFAECLHVPREQNLVADRLAREAQRQELAPLSYIVFYPCRVGTLKCQVDGQEIRVIHDTGAAAYNPQVLIDSRFLASLPSFGMEALATLKDSSPWTVLRGQVNMTVLGILARPLTIRVFKQEQHNSDHAIAVPRVIEDAVVILDLPVPLHVSFYHPALIDAAGTVSLGGEPPSHAFKPVNFPEQYHQHPYWQPSDTMFIGASLR